MLTREYLEDGKVISTGTLRTKSLIENHLNTIRNIKNSIPMNKFTENNWTLINDTINEGHNLLESYKIIKDKYGHSEELQTIKSILRDFYNWDIVELFKDIIPQGYIYGSQPGNGTCIGIWREGSQDSSYEALDKIILELKRYLNDHRLKSQNIYVYGLCYEYLDYGLFPTDIEIAIKTIKRNLKWLRTPTEECNPPDCLFCKEYISRPIGDCDCPAIKECDRFGGNICMNNLDSVNYVNLRLEYTLKYLKRLRKEEIL